MTRSRLPPTRRSITRRENHTGDLDAYVTVGFHPDGHPMEVFVKIGKEGSTTGGLCNLLGVLISLLLQYGVPWEVIALKLRGTNFPPTNEEGGSVAHTIALTVDQIIKEPPCVPSTPPVPPTIPRSP